MSAGQHLVSAPATYSLGGPTTWRYLPHRYPFMLLDMVQEYDPERQRAIGVKNVSQNDPFLQGHFPEHPIFPGVLIIEALAQASGMLMILEHLRAQGHVQGPPVRNIILAESKIKHMKPVYPGDQMLLETQIVLNRTDLCSFKVAATVQGEEVSKGQLTLARMAGMEGPA
jgi:3-hydroxyacyl-[acyl-carrier-protein] dehydratase